ncbi:hypothetical protein N9O33_08870, partial [Gammaproteobacteria bacterium]|nr:hypothetical protein [Gammaproteobacteria bacterium]
MSGKTLDLTGTGGAKQLSASTSNLDGSAYAGSITAIANINVATTASAATNAISFTGSDLNDTLTVGSAAAPIGAAITAANLGNGTGDVLNAYVKTSADIAGVTNVETINLIASTGNISVVGTSGANGVNQATAVNVSGGEAGKVVTLSGAITDHALTLDASNLAGSINANFAAAGLTVTGAADPISITGGAGTLDVVKAIYTDDAASNSGQFSMSGVETLQINTVHNGGGVTADTVNLAGTTGLSTVQLTTGATNANAVTLTGVAAGVAVSLGENDTVNTQVAADAFQGVTATVTLASATGSADALTVNLNDTNNAATTATLATNGVESLTLALSNDTENHSIALANTNTGKTSTVTVTGANTASDLTLTSIASTYTTLNAS